MAILFRVHSERAILYGSNVSEFLTYQGEEDVLLYLGDTEFLTVPVGTADHLFEEDVDYYTMNLIIKQRVLINRIMHTSLEDEGQHTIRLFRGPVEIGSSTKAFGGLVSLDLVRVLDPGTYEIRISRENSGSFQYSNVVNDGPVFGMTSFFADGENNTGAIPIQVEYVTAN